MANLLDYDSKGEFIRSIALSYPRWIIFLCLFI